MSFMLEITNLHFQGDKYSMRYDTCLHGKIYLKIGNEIICNSDNSEWNVSDGILKLLESFEKNHICDDSNSIFLNDNYKMVLSGEKDKSTVIRNMDWMILNYGVDFKMISNKGSVARISFYEYKKIVLSIAEKIERYYNECDDKEFDDLDSVEKKKAYEEFWNKWNNYKRKVVSNPSNIARTTSINYSNPIFVDSKNIMGIYKYGLLYRKENENYFIDFEKCAELFTKENEIFEKKYVAEYYKKCKKNDITYICFFTYPQVTVIEFYNLSLHDKLYMQNQNSYSKVCSQVAKLGWKMKEIVQKK